MCYGLPSCMSVKTTQEVGAVWEEARKIFFYGSDEDSDKPSVWSLFLGRGVLPYRLYRYVLL